MICPNCKTQNAPGARFCTECGAPLPEMPAQQAPVQQTQQTPPQVTYTEQPGSYAPPPQAPYTPQPGGYAPLPQTPYTVPPGGQVPPQMPFDAQPEDGKRNNGLTIVLIAAAILLLVACIVLVLLLVGKRGRGGDTGGGGSATGKTFTTRTETDASAEATSGASTGKTEAAPVSEVQYEAEIERHTLELTLDMGAGQEVVNTIRHDRIVLSDGAKEGMKQAVAEYNDTLDLTGAGLMESQGQFVYSWFISGFGEGMSFSDESFVTVHRADDRVFSFSVERSSFTGGAHPYTDYDAHTFDAQTGDKLTFSDVITDRTGFAEAVYAELMKNEEYVMLEEVQTESGGQSLLDMTKEYLTGGMLPVALSEEGAVALFGDYMLGSYVAGRAEILVPYEGNEALFASAYLEGVETGTTKQRVVTTELETEQRNLIGLCDELHINLYNFNDIAGTFYAGDGAYLEISKLGSFIHYNANGDLIASGDLMADNRWLNMICYDYFSSDLAGNTYGGIDVMSTDELRVTIDEYGITEEPFVRGGAAEGTGKGYDTPQPDETYACIGTYYFDGDRDLTHIEFMEDGSFICYYASGAVEAAGGYRWDSDGSFDFLWTGTLFNGDGSVFAEVFYYPMLDLVEINGNDYLKP